MKKSIVTVFALAACLVACNKAETPVNNAEPQAVRFSVRNLNSYTVKAAIDENVLSDVKVIAGAPINATASGTVDGTDLTVSPALYWTPGQTLSTKFVAITGNQTNVTVDSYTVSDQYHPYDYEYCAKLMSASATVAPGANVSLDFYHIFSKLVINITNNLGADVISTVNVSGIASVGSVNFDTRAVTITGPYNTNANAHERTANQVYEFALLPQTAAPTITVTTTLGAVYTFVLDPEHPFTFQGAKCATVDLTIGATASSAGSSTPVGVMAIHSVVDWATDATDFGTGDESTVLGDNYWYIQGTINGSNWATAYPMRMTATDVWEADFTYNKTLANDEGFKLHKTTGWGSDQLGADPANKVFTVGALNWGWRTGNDNIQLATAGSYHIKYDFTDGDKVYITAN